MKTVKELHTELRNWADLHTANFDEERVCNDGINKVLSEHYAPLLNRCEARGKVIRELAEVLTACHNLNKEEFGKNYKDLSIFHKVNSAITNAKKLINEQ